MSNIKDKIKRDRLTAQEVASLLNFSVRYIQYLCDVGKFDAEKFGRQWSIKSESVIKFHRAYAMDKST